MSKRQIDTTAYNKQLTDSIERLRRIVEEKITPENINYFSPQFIKKLENVYNYRFDDGGMVNSIDNYKFNSLIRKLKSGKVDFSRYSFTTFTQSELDLDIPVPQDFDGRNSFVLPFFAVDAGTSFSPVNFPALTAATTKKISLSINRNSSFVRITTDNIAEGSAFIRPEENKLYVIIFILFWRYI